MPIPKTLEELAIIEDGLRNEPSLSLKKLVDDVIKLVLGLDFTNNEQTIQKVIKVVFRKKLSHGDIFRH